MKILKEFTANLKVSKKGNIWTFWANRPLPDQTLLVRAKTKSNNYDEEDLVTFWITSPASGKEMELRKKYDNEIWYYQMIDEDMEYSISSYDLFEAAGHKMSPYATCKVEDISIRLIR